MAIAENFAADQHIAGAHVFGKVGIEIDHRPTSASLTGFLVLILATPRCIHVKVLS